MQPAGMAFSRFEVEWIDGLPSPSIHSTQFLIACAFEQPVRAQAQSWLHKNLEDMDTGGCIPPVPISSEFCFSSLACDFEKATEDSRRTANGDTL